MKKRKRRMQRLGVDTKTYSKIYNKGYWAGKMFFKGANVVFKKDIKKPIVKYSKLPTAKLRKEVLNLKTMLKGHSSTIDYLNEQLDNSRKERARLLQEITTLERRNYDLKTTEVHKPIKETNSTGWTMARALSYKIKVW